MKRFRTLLRAEDGHYLMHHDTHEAASLYVQYQMGSDNPERYFNAFMDDWGRTIAITDDETGLNLDLYEEPKAPEEILTIGELEDQLMDLEIQLGEMQAEHRSETAMFGDSGPGTQCRISDFAAGVSELRSEIEAREDAFVGPIPMTWYEAERWAAYQQMINFVGPVVPVPF